MVAGGWWLVTAAVARAGLRWGLSRSEFSPLPGARTYRELKMPEDASERTRLLEGEGSHYLRWGVFCIFLFPALGGLLFGYDIGSTSLVVNQLTKDDVSGVEWAIKVNLGIIKSLITSASVGGAFLGSLMVFAVADQIGRRVELLVGGTLYAVGAAISIMSSLSFISSDADAGIVVLILGRIIYGVGIGFSMHGAPSYISEMSPPGIRGTLVSAKEGVIVFGVLMGNALGFALEKSSRGWTYIYMTQFVLALLMILGNYSLPPSARWLALRKHYNKVASSLRLVYPESAVDRIFQEIKEQQNQLEALLGDSSAVGCFSGMMKLIGNKRFRPQLICGIGVIALQQITGQPSVLYYAATIFEDAGINSAANLAVGAFKLLATFFSVVLVDRMGRKQLLYVGNTVMALSLAAVCVAFSNYDSSGGLNLQKGVIIGMLLCYIGGYQVGFGPVAWTLISEVFPLEVRGQAVALAVQANFFLNLLVSLLFLVELNAIGSTATFGIFAVILVYSLYFVHKYVPETKGLSLEQIEKFFQGNQEFPAAVEELVVSSKV